MTYQFDPFLGTGRDGAVLPAEVRAALSSDATASRAALGLGTAAATDAAAYATAAQGAKAEAALPATADAIANVLESAAIGAPADLARIRASVSDAPTVRAGIAASPKLSRAAAGVTRNRIRSIIIFGDSMSELNTNFASAYYDTSYLAWAAALAGVDVELVRNAGIGGNNVDDMLARVDADVMAYQSDAVIEMSGINGIATRDAAYQIGVKQQFWSKFLADGRYVINCSSPPHNIGTDPTISRLAALNTLQAQYWRRKEGLGEYVDWYSAVANTTSATVPWKTTYTNDGTHQNNRGAQEEGFVLAPSLSRLCAPKILVSSPRDTRQYDSSSSNLVDNPLMLGTSGTNGAGCSGAIATSWSGLTTGGTTAVHSKGTANSGAGEKQIVVLTGGGTNGTYSFYSPSVAARTALGRKVEVQCRIKVISATGLTALQVYTSGPTGGASAWGYKTGNAQAALRSDFELKAAYGMPVTLAGTMSSLFLFVKADLLAGGTATIEIEQVALRDYGV